MTSLLLALQFLTIIPVKVKSFTEKKLITSMVFFPVIGFFVASLLMAANFFFLFLGFNNFTVNIILVILLIAITGGMHLDGLSDTFDGLSSGNSKDAILAVMRDPRCGVMGALSIICVLLLKISFLSSVSLAQKSGALILMCATGRWSLVFLLFMFPYARPSGKGKTFSEGINLKIFITATVFPLSCAVIFFGISGIWVMVFAMLIAFLFGRFIVKKVGGITGDSLGASCELVEAAVLFLIAIMAKAGLIYG